MSHYSKLAQELADKANTAATSSSLGMAATAIERALVAAFQAGKIEGARPVNRCRFCNAPNCENTDH